MLLRWHVNINIILLNVTKNIILNPNLTNTSSSSHASSPTVHSAKRISRNSHPRYSCTYSHFKWASDFLPCWHVNININLNVTNIILNPNLNASSSSHASSPYSAVVHSAKRISRNSHPRYSCTYYHYSHFKWASDILPWWRKDHGRTYIQYRMYHHTTHN